MTITYDPNDPLYLDEADVRGELTRAFNLCEGCRRCTDLCPSFPTLFTFLDRRDDHDAGWLVPAQQDRVVDGCFQCGTCVIECPHAPGRSESVLDMPRLMLRANAMRWANDHVPLRAKVGVAIAGRADVVAAVAARAGSVATAFAGSAPGSLVRRAVGKAVGIPSQRLLPPVARERFTTWFARRVTVRLTDARARVAVYPTCLVEYQQPGIGRDLVKVFEHNGIECSLADGAGCCGAPYLHGGDVESFVRTAVKNVRALASHVRAGRDVVVAQPTCSLVIRRDYPDFVGGPDAELLAAHTFDAAEYLMRAHSEGEAALDTSFTGDVPDTIAYHAPCRLRAQDVAVRSRDLLRLTGASVTVVAQCSGGEEPWSGRARFSGWSASMAETLGRDLAAAGTVAAGDCARSNAAVESQTGVVARHPIQVIARAYGIPEEP
jgi:Fe-S oxidoreductase